MVDVENKTLVTDREAGAVLNLLLNRYGEALKSINKKISAGEPTDEVLCKIILSYLIGTLMTTDWMKDA